MTDNRDQFESKAEPKGPPGMLAHDGTGKTIVCDAAALAGSDDTFMDFLVAAEAQGYRVVVQSPEPQRDLDGALGRKIRNNVRFQVFMEQRPTSRPVLLQGAPEVLKGQVQPYLRITHERNFRVNEWSPTDRRLGLSVYFWAQGLQPSLEEINARRVFLDRQLRAKTAELRRMGMVGRTRLIEDLRAAGIDPVQFFADIDAGRIPARRGPFTPR